MNPHFNYDIISKDEFFITEADDGLPWVSRIAREHWGPAFYMERVASSRVFIAFVQKGKGSVSGPNGTVELIPGSVLSLSITTGRYRFQVSPEADLHLLIFTMNNSVGRELAWQHLPKNVPVLPLADPGRVEALFYRLLETGEKGGFHSSRIAAGLVTPILLTIDQEYRSHSDADDRMFALFTRCRVYIENNWSHLTSVRDIPSRFGISQPYMGKLFRTYEGCTPYQFLLKQKMNYAVYELQSGNRRIAEIAEQLGFSDPYSFSKTFKRVIGQPPSSVRGRE